MARRSSKSEVALIVLVMLIGFPIYVGSKLVESVGLPALIGIATGGLVIWLWYRSYKRRNRIKFLTAKYGDAETVQNIMDCSFWQGQSEEQLRDSLGQPVDIDRIVMKTKTKEVWKYRHRGGNRYGLRITLEDGQVVGWNNKA